MKKLIYITCALLLLVRLAFAQHAIQGKVTEENQQAIPFAAVALHAAADSSVIKGGISDEEGKFVLLELPPGEYFVSVQHVGFQKKNSPSFTLSDQLPSVMLETLSLPEAVQTLSEVTVTAQRPLVEQKVDRMVLNVENSVVTKGNKVIDLLKYAPLVQVDNGSIKVANNGSVLVLIDGKQVGSAALQSYLQNFSAEDVLKVEVVTNPSVKYDASYRSVINIVTKKSLDMGLKGRVALIYSQGQRGRFTPDASLTYRKAKWNIFSSISAKRENDLYDQQIDRFFPDGSMRNDLEGLDETQALSGFVSVDHYLSDQHTIGIRVNGNGDRTIGTADNTTSFFSGSVLPDSLLNTTNDGISRDQTYDINLNYQGTLDSVGQKLEVNLTQTVLDARNRQDITYRSLSLSEVTPPRLVQVDNPSKQYSTIAQIDYTLPTRHARWEIGTRFFSVKNDNEVVQRNLSAGEAIPSSRNANTYREQTYAAYANYARTLKDVWNVQLGLRAEQTDQTLDNADVSRNYMGLFPSAGVNRPFGEGYTWGVTYSRKIARPGLSSLVPYRYILDPYTWAEGNPDLRPQYANIVDSYMSLGNLVLYLNYQKTRDHITGMIYARDRTYWQIQENLDHTHTAYLGANWSGNLVSWWQTNSNVTLTGTYVRTTLDEAAEYTFRGGGFSAQSVNIFSLPKKWKLELNLNYNAPSQWLIWNTKALYWAEISINKPILREQGNLRITAEDIFRTQRNRLSTEYGPVNLRSQDYYDNQRVRISFSYNFGKKTVKDGSKKSLGNEDIKSRMR